MKNRIFNNLILKIISVVLAIIAWLILVNVSDPTTAITVGGVNVRFENESSLTEKGYTYEVLDGAKISVDISGPKSEVTSVSASDIDAYVDLSKLSPFSDYADISVNVIKDGAEVGSLTVTPKTTSVKLNVGNRSNKEFKITAETEGELPEGKVLANTKVSPTNVRIAGPESDVDEIYSVKAICDISDKENHISEDINLKLYNEDGEEINNPVIEVSRSLVKYSADIFSTKTVKIDYELGGAPAEGSEVTYVELSEDEATISGNDEALSQIDKLTIPASALDISGLSYSKTFKIWLPDIMPEGVEVLSENSLWVTVYIDE